MITNLDIGPYMVHMSSQYSTLFYEISILLMFFEAVTIKCWSHVGLIKQENVGAQSRRHVRGHSSVTLVLLQ